MDDEWEKMFKETNNNSNREYDLHSMINLHSNHLSDDQKKSVIYNFMNVMNQSATNTSEFELNEFANILARKISSDKKFVSKFIKNPEKAVNKLKMRK